MPNERTPRLTVVVLTWNEARNIGACLASLARQREQDFEVVVLDAASTDGTADIVRAAQARFPVPLRLEVASHRIPIGQARNQGVAVARAPKVAFLSADAEADEHWAEEVLASLRAGDMVFGRQVHAPHAWTIGAAVRGLRYHFPDGPAADPLKYASNVSAGFHREVLQAFPFEPDTNAAEDLLLGKRASDAGYHATYNPAMVVYHHDVDDARVELRKNLREGAGCAVHAAELGLHTALLAWSALLGLALVLFLLDPGGETLLLLAGALWLPALRRAWRRRAAMPPRALLLGLAASPVFDLAFLLAYLGGLAGVPPRRARVGGGQPQETDA